MRRARVIVPSAAPGQRLELSREDSHHLARVLRRCEGDAVEVLSESGAAFLATVEEVRPGKDDPGAVRVWVRIEEAAPPRSSLVLPWTVAVGLIKGSGLEIVVRLASELGLEGLIPLICDRSVARDVGGSKRERWARIARESAKQCGRPQPLAIQPVATLEEVLGRQSDRSVWIALPGGPAASSDLLVGRGGPEPARFLVGPEGGFSTREVRLAERSGARPLGFETPVLRTPTAVLLIGALGVLARGEQGGPEEAAEDVKP